MTLDLIAIGQAAKQAAHHLARATTEQKNAALQCIADALEANSTAILSANRADLQDGQAHGLSDAMLDRLSLQGRLTSIAKDVRHVVQLADPVGEVFDAHTLPNGLKVYKQRTPLGVLGIIYEARPNVTVDVAALALKTGNAAILRGGSETLRSNIALVDTLKEAFTSCDLPADAIQLIADTDRAYVGQLLKLHNYVDMIIPRGGAGLHQFCRENSTIPVITGGIGICHLFVDESADLTASLPIIYNAKIQRPTVCNALDTLLVHRSVAAAFIPQVMQNLGQAGVTFRLSPTAAQIVPPDGHLALAAGPQDFDTEWLSFVLGIEVIDDVNQAITHIRQHSTGHSDGILTQDDAHAAQFIAEVDSAAVYVNASTRFTDGGQLGLGAEVAISTQKLHARGPMGLRELTTYKWVIIGDYHVRP